MRLMSEQVKARLEAVGVSELDISAPCLNGGWACELLLLYHVSIKIYLILFLTCTHMHSNVYTCACVHLLIISFDVYIHRGNHIRTRTNAL